MKDRLKTITALTADDTAVLLYQPISRKYISGFSSSLGYLFVTQEKTVLLVDGRYAEAAEKSVLPEIEVRLFQDLAADGKEILSNRVKRLLVEVENTVEQVSRFSDLFGVEILPSAALSECLRNLRQSKNEGEIAAIQQAQRIAERALDEVLGWITVGVSEREIAAELEYRMKRLGSSEPSFNTIAVAGENSSLPHGEPTDRKVKKGDFITMDFGAVFDGYHSDMTRTIAIGKVSPLQQRVYDTVLAANQAALEAVAEGITAAAVDKAARDVIEQAGYGKEFCHSTGHGVGLEIHETPNLSCRNTSPLQTGQVITIEPGIYLPQRFGVRIEDMVVVTKNGCNNLTKAVKSLIIL